MNRIYFKNLPLDYNVDELKELVSKAGLCKRLKINFNKDGSSLGTGFCEFEDENIMYSAQRNLNKIEINNKILKVSWFENEIDDNLKLFEFRINNLNLDEKIYLFKFFQNLYFKKDRRLKVILKKHKNFKNILSNLQNSINLKIFEEKQKNNFNSNINIIQRNNNQINNRNIYNNYGYYKNYK